MKTLITDEQVARVVRAYILRYLERCDENRINRGTAARLIGVSRTRIGQLEKAARNADDSIMVNLDVFLRIRQLLPWMEQGQGEGVLPAGSTRGKAQNPVLEYFGIETNAE